MDGTKMTILVNGKEEKIEAQTSLLDFLSFKNLDPDTVVVELNLDIIKKDQLKNTILQNNDKLEVLRFVGGG